MIKSGRDNEWSALGDAGFEGGALVFIDALYLILGLLEDDASTTKLASQSPMRKW